MKPHHVYLSAYLVFYLPEIALCKQSCEIDLNEVAHWANNLPALQREDALKWNQLQTYDSFMMKEEQVRHKFYQILSQPLQTACSIAKKIGGEWLRGCAWYDGSKFVCLDKWKGVIESGKCLVYSFGLSDDWSFEETLADMGCTVRGFDPSTDRPKSVTSERITFDKIGLSHFTGKTQIMDNKRNNKKILAPVMTLSDILEKYKEKDTSITYLKLDVEGSELEALEQILKSDVLKNVEQIGVELHTGQVHIKDHKIARTLGPVLETIKAICDKYGFKIIDYEPNGCVGKSQDKLEHRYHTYFDIVLYKP